MRLSGNLQGKNCHNKEQGLDGGNPRTWLPDLDIGLGVWQGEFEGITRGWLRWYNETGDWILTSAERDALRAEQERQRANEAEQRVAELERKLRELGLEP